jgi:hypothetical protein
MDKPEGNIPGGPRRRKIILKWILKRDGMG